ncbi:hypothetical protein LCGC14_3097270 [marine sediment metagenome]|uniref:Uncharacterized protein n=1 Tax=marine sediment metagenome TaxID=412755 RepID=A0A0F8W9A1_9ZZZZ
MDQEKYDKMLKRARIKRRESINRQFEIDMEKYQKTLIYALKSVKDQARPDTWSSAHKNCFRCSIGKGESEKHIRKKFERYLEWRKLGAVVFTELRLKDGSRPDLIVCLNNGSVFIEEIVESEKEASLLIKEKKYPFPIRIVRG